MARNGNEIQHSAVNGMETWRLLVRSAFLFGFLLVLTLISVALDLPFHQYATSAVRHEGLLGVFVFVLIVDTFIVPASLDLVFPITMTWNPIPLLTVMSVASVLGGILGYWIGRTLFRVPFIRNTVSGYYDRGSAMVKRYGMWSVVIAGLFPIPFSTVSWIAGMLRLPFHMYTLAALSRIPRIVAYWALLRAGVEIFS